MDPPCPSHFYEFKAALSSSNSSSQFTQALLIHRHQTYSTNEHHRACMCRIRVTNLLTRTEKPEANDVLRGSLDYENNIESSTPSDWTQTRKKKTNGK